MYGTMPPVNFEKLYNGVLNNCSVISVDLVKDIDNLVLRKKEGDELSYGAVIPSIQGFIETEVKRLSAKETQEKWPQYASPENLDVLNSLFIRMLTKSSKNY
jgi:hypothetical protein